MDRDRTVSMEVALSKQEKAGRFSREGHLKSSMLPESAAHANPLGELMASSKDAASAAQGAGTANPIIEEYLGKLVRAMSTVMADAQQAQETHARQIEEIKQTVQRAQQETRDRTAELLEMGQEEMRQMVETLVTQVNDISRTLTEASRSQQRWM